MKTLKLTERIFPHLVLEKREVGFKTGFAHGELATVKGVCKDTGGCHQEIRLNR